MVATGSSSSSRTLTWLWVLAQVARHLVRGQWLPVQFLPPPNILKCHPQVLNSLPWRLSCLRLVLMSSATWRLIYLLYFCKKNNNGKIEPFKPFDS